MSGKGGFPGAAAARVHGDRVDQFFAEHEQADVAEAVVAALVAIADRIDRGIGDGAGEARIREAGLDSIRLDRFCDRVGAAGDNAAMESFFSLLQKNVLNRRRWDTRDQLRIAIVTWIERTYHRRRRQAALGRLTPVEYELIMTTPATQAA